MITQSEIARKDFNRVCELNGYETFTKEQVEGYAGHIKSLIHKSETSNLSGGEIEAINTFNEDLPELHKAIVLNDDLTRELVYYRERKVIFDDVIEKSEGNDIEKARTGTYANTSQNRKLGRVGKKYDPRDKKAEDDKAKTGGKKPLSVPSMDESLARDYHKGEMTIQEVAEELHEAGRTSSVDTEYAKKMVDKFKGGEKKGEGGTDTGLPKRRTFYDTESATNYDGVRLSDMNTEKYADKYSKLKDISREITLSSGKKIEVVNWNKLKDILGN